MSVVFLDGAVFVAQESTGELFTRYEAFLYKLLVFVVTFVIAVVVGRLVAMPIIKRLLGSKRITPTVRQPATKAARVAVYFLAFFAGLFFARLESLLTVTGGFAAALTLAIGFASRDVLSNLVGGLFIITDPKFNLGDWIEWNGNSTEGNTTEQSPTEGIIEDISFRTTRVRTFRNELITIPNSTLANAVVINHDIRDTLRIDYPFSVEYGGNVNAMREVLLEEAEANPHILANPEPSVIVDGVTAAGIDMVSRFWIANPSRQKYLSIRSAYFQAVKERFEREGYEMSPDLLELTGDFNDTVISDAQNETEDNRS